jgi:hypothetical protein
MTGQWSPRLVEAYLAEAAQSLSNATELQVDVIFQHCPAVVRQSVEERSVGGGAAGASTAEQLPQVLAVIRWLGWLDEEQQQIVWHRAEGRKWKAICQQLGIDRTTAWRRWTYATVTIAAHLNAKQDATTLQHQDIFHSDSDALSSQHESWSVERDAR